MLGYLPGFHCPQLTTNCTDFFNFACGGVPNSHNIGFSHIILSIPNIIMKYFPKDRVHPEYGTKMPFNMFNLVNQHNWKIEKVYIFQKYVQIVKQLNSLINNS